MHAHYLFHLGWFANSFWIWASTYHHSTKSPKFFGAPIPRSYTMFAHRWLARIFLFLSLFSYILEMLDHANYHVWFHLLPTTLDRRGRTIIWILQLCNNADGGHQTRVAGTASERAIYYTIASRLTKSPRWNENSTKPRFPISLRSIKNLKIPRKFSFQHFLKNWRIPSRKQIQL